VNNAEQQIFHRKPQREENYLRGLTATPNYFVLELL